MAEDIAYRKFNAPPSLPARLRPAKWGVPKWGTAPFRVEKAEKKGPPPLFTGQSRFRLKPLEKGPYPFSGAQADDQIIADLLRPGRSIARNVIAERSEKQQIAGFGAV